MDIKPMEPFGVALLAYFKGDTTAKLIIRRDDGQENLPTSQYFFS